MPLFKSCASPSKSSASSAKTPLTLHYFDTAGRGNVLRLLLRIGNITFIDDRVDFAQWEERKDQMPFGQMPVLSLECGTMIPQSVAILAFLERKLGWSLDCPIQAAKVRSVICTLQDIFLLYGKWFNADEMDRETLKGPLSEEFVSLVKLLDAYVAGMQKDGFAIGNDKDTIADAAIADFACAPPIQQLPLPFDRYELINNNAPTLRIIADRFKKTHQERWNEIEPAYLN